MPTVVGGQNWLATMSDQAATAGFLAGFSITFITMIVSTSTAHAILVSPVHWGDIAVTLFGLTSVMFITATELFLRAKEFNLWDLPESYSKYLQKSYTAWDWEKSLEDSDDTARKYQGRARRAYNSAIFLLFIGVFFVVGSYNIWVALIITGSGLASESFQAFR
jgi:cytochrome c biogenesis protein CcdA